MKFIHAADLHLSEADKKYCLTVLDEIGSAAENKKASLILFVGDTFDTYTDAVSLRSDFRNWSEDLPEGCSVLLVTGNHEELNRGGNSLASLDLGRNTRLFHDGPFNIHVQEDTEFFVIPYQEGFIDASGWDIPPKKRRFRVVAVHGTVAGMAYSGAGGEAGNSALDPAMFRRLSADYAALGHIHGHRVETIGDIQAVYPGSARVWRSGEEGERRVMLVSTGSSLSAVPMKLESPGQFREYRLALDINGMPPALDGLAKGWGGNDWISLVFTGLVEDENQVTALEEKIKKDYGGAVRLLTAKKEVMPLKGISSQPIVRKFLEACDKLDAGGGDPVTMQYARETGLKAIAAKLGVKP